MTKKKTSEGTYVTEKERDGKEEGGRAKRRLKLEGRTKEQKEGRTKESKPPKKEERNKAGYTTQDAPIMRTFHHRK